MAAVATGAMEEEARAVGARVVVVRLAAARVVVVRVAAARVAPGASQIDFLVSGPPPPCFEGPGP